MLRNIFFHKNTVGENSTSRFRKEKRRSAKSDVSKVLFPDIGKITNLASLDDKAWWQGMEMLEIFACLTLAAVHFVDQNWIPKTVCCVRCVMVCKNGFTNWNAKIALLRVSMVVTYYIKLFRTGADRRNGILMFLLFLVAETINTLQNTVKNTLLKYYGIYFNRL